MQSLAVRSFNTSLHRSVFGNDGAYRVKACDFNLLDPMLRGAWMARPGPTASSTTSSVNRSVVNRTRHPLVDILEGVCGVLFLRGRCRLHPCHRGRQQYSYVGMLNGGQDLSIVSWNQLHHLP